MEKKYIEFQNASSLFKECGFSLWLVGGTVRDYLLGIPFDDMDAVTDATPEEMKIFLPDADYTFAKYGTVKCMFDGVKFDITTLRQEKSYIDSRHPKMIKFVDKPSLDYPRRDFTINGLYLDEKYRVIDYVNGLDDLSKKIIRVIGNSNKRIKEDPLRILRALRFAALTGFALDESLIKSINKNISLLEKINKDKIRHEIFKISKDKLLEAKTLFSQFNIQHLLDVIK